MASSPPPPGGGPSARDPMTVGRNFVKQYYHCLSTSPENIVKFYKPVSVFSNGQGSVPTTPTLFAESNDLLKERLISESFRLDLEHGAIDAQMGVGGGVLVVVTGHLVIEEERRAFCHTFFLNVFSAPDSKKNLYYVHNDIMRFLADEGKKEAEEEEVAAAEVTQEEIVVEKAQEAVAETTAEEPTAAAPAAVQEPEAVPEPAVVEETPMYEPALEPEPAVEETKENIVEERDSKSKRKGKSRGGRKKSLSPTTGEDSKKQQQQPAPESWASMVAHAASAPVPPSPTRKKETDAQAKGENKPERQAVQEQQQQQQGRQQRGSGRMRDPDCTLVIKNVPEGTREREVRELFEPFAIETKSKILGINVSGSKSLAFVDYDSPEPVIMALKAKQQFQLQGRNLELEPKMVTKNQPKGKYRDRQGGGDGSSNGFRGSSGKHRRRGSGGGRGDRGGGGKGGRGGGR